MKQYDAPSPTVVEFAVASSGRELKLRRAIGAGRGAAATFTRLVGYDLPSRPTTLSGAEYSAPARARLTVSGEEYSPPDLPSRPTTRSGVEYSTPAALDRSTVMFAARAAA
jgi:hypothetical protein